MELLKEKQLTLRASKRPIEYNYTNADIHHENTNEHDGYQFEYPVNWAGDPSTNKVIGIRRISYKPASIDLAFSLTVFDAQGNEDTFAIANVFTAENTFEECIYVIQKQINDHFFELGETARCIMLYNKETAQFDMRIEDSEFTYPFSFVFNIGADYHYNHSEEQWQNGFDKDGRHYTIEELTHHRREFLKLFNYPINRENIDKSDNIKGKKFFRAVQVWNRDNFYCHATFSDSPKQIIGVNKDFWPTPSVFYANSTNSNDFNVYFTTDTVHRILPRNGVLLIQFSYIFNYQNSMLTYA